jgi:hypothetical protein
LEIEQKMKMVHRRMAPLLLLGAFFFLLDACSSGGASTSTISDSGDQGASPLPTAALATKPTAEQTPTSPPNLTPEPDLGLVQGVLYMDNQPAVGQTLYLAPVLPGGEGMKVAALDATKDPRAETDASGTFTFQSVPEGEYALGIMGPVGPVLIRGDDDQEITVDVQVGRLTDIGPIYVPSFN